VTRERVGVLGGGVRSSRQPRLAQLPWNYGRSGQ
jgi:hypothetical protein